MPFRICVAGMFISSPKGRQSNTKERPAEAGPSNRIKRLFLWQVASGRERLRDRPLVERVEDGRRRELRHVRSEEHGVDVWPGNARSRGRVDRLDPLIGKDRIAD